MRPISGDKAAADVEVKYWALNDTLKHTFKTLVKRTRNTSETYMSGLNAGVEGYAQRSTRF